MRAVGILLATGTMSLLFAGTASAQRLTSADYNYLRANQHFAGSRYSYRVLSTLSPGYGSAVAAPFVYQSQYIEPGFSRQRIMPHGYEYFQVVPGYGAATMTPYTYSSVNVPGYSYGYYLPYRR